MACGSRKCSTPSCSTVLPACQLINGMCSVCNANQNNINVPNTTTVKQ